MATFARVTVDHIVAGNTRVSWELDRHFIDPLPYTFQLQYCHAYTTDNAEWTNVGATVVNTYFATDVSKRIYGKLDDSYYRVKLVTSVDTYYSTPVRADGLLSKKDWLLAREITRKEQLRHAALTSPRGYLLKVRRYGPRCTECTDEFTQEVKRSLCDTCYGTGYEGGYFDPIPAFYADVSLEASRDHRNPQTGMENKHVIKARFIGDPLVYSYDVWVNQFSDERYYLHEITAISHIRGVNIIYDAELRLAPYSDIIYTYPIGKTVPDVPPGLKTEAPKKNKEEQWKKTSAKSANFLETYLTNIKRKKRAK